MSESGSSPSDDKRVERRKGGDRRKSSIDRRDLDRVADSKPRRQRPERRRDPE